MSPIIDIAKLRAVKRLVTHANCPDGVASALIVKDALPDVEVLFVAHGTKEHRELRPDVPTLFCDFTPWSDPKTDAQWLMWTEAGALVLDHHPTQRDLTMMFVEAGLGAYGENDRLECGAWLAYEHVWLPLKTHEFISEPTLQKAAGIEEAQRAARNVQTFAELAGVRDTWKKEDPRWQAACEQAAYLAFWPFEFFADASGSGLARAIRCINSRVLLRERLGALLVEKQLELARKAIDESYFFQTEHGTPVLMFQGVTPTSDAAEICEKEYERHGPNSTLGLLRGEPFPKLDIVAGFHYRVDAGRLQLQFSTRSHTGYDVGAFCKSLGGGGHTAAAGFTVEQSAESGTNPYAVFKLLLEEWEAGQ